MVIDPVHRALTREYSVETYHMLATDCVTACSEIPGVLSVAIFGSLAKNDIIPAWSDLDLLVFLHSSREVFAVLSQLRSAIAAARGDIAIGVGADIIDTEHFRRSYRLGGRPTYVSYDVALYCRVHHGPNLFSSLPPIESRQQAISFERPIALAAELHNWRNAFINSHAFDRLAWSARCIKTMLKLLQYKTGPLLQPPFTYEGSLEKLMTLEPDHPMREEFAFAVESRRRWPLLVRQPELLDCSVQRITSAVAAYGQSAPGDLL